ncbi:MAG: DNA translocase FtsK 4TM domain-containing protein [Gammaproteobacteria bacterium]
MAKSREPEPDSTGLILSHLSPAAREAAFWLSGALAVVLAVALASFNAADSSYTVSTSATRVHNLIGPAGAWTSDVLLFILGASAYVLPLLIAYCGWLLFRGLSQRSGWARATRLAALAVGLLALSTLLALVASPGPEWLPSGAGGVVGKAIGAPMIGVLGDTGTALVLLAVLIAAITVATGLSWLALMDRVGAFGVRLNEWTYARFQRWRERRQARTSREERSLKVEREHVRRKSRPQPRIEPTVRVVPPSPRAERERQKPLFVPKPVAGGLPSLELLDPPPEHAEGYSKEALTAMSRLVEIKLRDFGVDVEVVTVHAGPVITRFELQPAAGVKVSQISQLSKDLARALSAVSVRVVEIIPGKTVVGLEVPNEARELVTFGEILRSEAYERSASKLTLALGRDISGQAVITDLGRMPHLLIAGTTGSGKSVAINAMILSLLYKSSPEDVRLILIDPKMLELSVYDGIPHLLTPVVTDMSDAGVALKWCVTEMDRRYRRLASAGVRNLASFNRKLRDMAKKGESLPDPLAEPDENGERTPLEPMPNIVVVIDELADLMLVTGKKVEELIARLAQKARAAGIHLLVATQRPSVDVITGLIKANIPARIAFQVSARVDSRTIIDQMGAESLLGDGDMLYLPPGTSLVQRVHGAFVSDAEVHRVTAWLKESGEPAYLDAVLESVEEGSAAAGGAGASASDEDDPLYDEAVRIVTETRRASISAVQRRLRIGYNRAARLVEQMERVGIVSPLQPNGSREVLAAPPPE